MNYTITYTQLGSTYHIYAPRSRSVLSSHPHLNEAHLFLLAIAHHLFARDPFSTALLADALSLSYSAVHGRLSLLNFLRLVRYLTHRPTTWQLTDAARELLAKLEVEVKEDTQ